MSFQLKKIILKYLLFDIPLTMIEILTDHVEHYCVIPKISIFPPPHPHGGFFWLAPHPLLPLLWKFQISYIHEPLFKNVCFCHPIPLGISTDPLWGEIWIFSGIASSWYNNSLQLVVSEVCIVECSKRLWVFHN